MTSTPQPRSGLVPGIVAGLLAAVLGTFIGAVGLLVKFNGGAPAYGDAVRVVAEVFPDAVTEDPKTLLFWVIAGAAGFSFVNKRVKAAREALAAPSHAQQAEAPVENFKPRNPA